MPCLALAESYSEVTAQLLRGRLTKTPPRQGCSEVKSNREELEVEDATDTAEEEQGSEEEEEVDATEKTCRDCGLAQMQVSRLRQRRLCGITSPPNTT